MTSGALHSGSKGASPLRGGATWEVWAVLSSLLWPPQGPLPLGL